MERVIIYALLYFVEAVIAWIYFSNIYNHTKSAKFTVISFSIGYAILFVLSQIGNVYSNLFSFVCLNLVLAKTNFECSWKSAVFHSALMTFIMGVAELLPNTLFVSRVAGFDGFLHNMLALVLLTVISKLLYFIFVILIAKLVFSKSKSHDQGFYALLCVIPMSTLLFIGTITHIGITASLNEESENLLIICLLVLLIMNISAVFIYNSMQRLNEEKATMSLSLLRDKADTEYYSLLQRQYDGQQILIHNIKRHLGVIGMSADAGDLEGCAQYVREMQNLPELTQRTNLCKNRILNMILLDYVEQCEEKQIRFHTDIRTNELAFMDDTQITALFRNLLSNALEAAAVSKEKIISFSITQKPEQGYLFVSVVNSCDISPVSDGMGGFKSIKQDSCHHGYGTKSIERVVKRYKGTSRMYYSTNEKRFHADILFPIG